MKRKWLLALGISCPACAGGFILVMGAVFGLSAALVKGSLLLAGVTMVGFLWGRNAWRRRGEDACKPGPDGAPAPCARPPPTTDPRSD